MNASTALRARINRLCARALALLAAVLVLPAAAQQSRSFDGFEIHYNAFRADFLPVEVARRLGLTRSADRGLLNVTVLRRRSDGSTESREAEIAAVATGREHGAQSVRMRAMREPEGLSYVGEFRIAGDETYRFELRVRPFGAERTYHFSFSQSLVAD